MKDKDFIIKTKGGLYVMHRDNGTLRLTSLNHATHYHSKGVTKTDLNKLGGRAYLGLKIIDIREEKKNRKRKVVK